MNFETLSYILGICGVVILIGIWKGKTDEKMKDLRVDVDNAVNALEKEKEERKNEYTKIQIKLSELSSGQEWIIMKLKGEL